MRKGWHRLTLFLVAASAFPLRMVTAQTAGVSDAVLAKRVESSPILPLRERHLQLRGLPMGSIVGLVSGVAAGGNGIIYVMQRGKQADPILAFDLRGDLLRSWGRGDFVVPHSLRVDPDGNVWAVDAGASVVIKYSPGGKKLLTIVVGQAPDTGSPFRGATDVAFARNGHLLVTDGYGNARILEYSADGRRIRE